MRLYFVFFSLVFFSVSANAKEGGRRALKVGMFQSQIELTDLKSVSTYQQIVFLKQVGQTLIENGPLGEVLPGLAKTWDISDDGKVYTFNLREAYFHDGSRVSAEDVVYSLHRATLSNGNVASYYLQVIEPNNGLLAESVDQVVIRLTRPYSPLLSMLSSGALAIAKKTTTEGTKFVGSGPYKIDSRDGVRVHLSAFSKYSGSYPPRTPKIEVISDAELANVKRKPDPSELPDYEVLAVGPRMPLYDEKSFERLSAPAMVTGALFVNVRLKKYRDKAARLGLLAMFQKVLKEDLFSHPGRIHTDLFPKGMIAYNGNRPGFGELLKQLKTAKIPDKKTKICINFHTMLGAETKFKEAILNSSGNNVEFIRSPFIDALKEWQNYTCDAFFMTWQSVFLDPEASLVVFRILKPFPDQKVANKFHKLSDAASALAAPASRAALYSELSDFVFGEAVMLPVFQPDHVEFLNREFTRSNAVYRYQQMFSEIYWK